MAYKIEYTKSASKFLKKMDKKRKIDFLSAFEMIAESETTEIDSLDIVPMKGKFQGYFRLRIGSYRAIFEIQDNKLVLLVLKVSPRGDVYKG